MIGQKEDYINYRISKSKEIYQDALLLANFIEFDSETVIPLMKEVEELNIALEKLVLML